MNKKVILAALAGLSSTTLMGADKSSSHHHKHSATKTQKSVLCWGVNKCQAHAQCGVEQSDIEATKKVFKDRFVKSTPHACHAAGKCSAAKGYLAWEKKPSKDECIKSGGFLIVKAVENK